MQRVGVFSTAMALCFATLVAAEPITFHGRVTSGFLEVTSHSTTNWHFAGEGFSVSGTGEPGGITICDPCAAGETVRLGGDASGSSLGVGAGTIGGTSFDWLSWSGYVEFDAGTFTFPDSAPGSYTVTRPFQFAAAMNGWLDGAQSELAASTDLILGSGLATYRYNTRLFDDAFRIYEFDGVRFDFGEASAAPVPEPATLTLLGAGLAGVAVRRWRRRGA